MPKSWLLPRVLAIAILLSCQAPAQSPARTVLAIGAHAGDMEVSCGAILAKQKRLGDRIVMLHLSLGEAGHPGLKPKAYGEQKRREAVAAAADIGAEVIFGPYRDGEIPDNETARRYVAEVIRQVRPAFVITHWRESIHKDHEAAHRIVRDAVLLASLESVVTDHPRYRGVRGVYYTENWEDRDGFQPYLCVDVAGQEQKWKQSAARYEFARGAISKFPYVDYYLALMKVRGAESGRQSAVCFDVEPAAKKRVLDTLP